MFTSVLSSIIPCHEFISLHNCFFFFIVLQFPFSPLIYRYRNRCSSWTVSGVVTDWLTDWLPSPSSSCPWNCCGCAVVGTHSTHPHSLRHCAKDWIVPTNTGPVLLIRRLGVAHLVELGRRGQHTATEPHRVPLHVVRNHRHVDRLRLQYGQWTHTKRLATTIIHPPHSPTTLSP